MDADLQVPNTEKFRRHTGLELRILRDGMVSGTGRSIAGDVPHECPPMRLTSAQVDTVLHTVARHAGESARVAVFGSRLDDQARGGDLDLFIETATPLPLLARARLQLELEGQLGLPVDLVVHPLGTVASPFQQIARARALPLRRSR